MGRVTSAGWSFCVSHVRSLGCIRLGWAGRLMTSSLISLAPRYCSMQCLCVGWASSQHGSCRIVELFKRWLSSKREGRSYPPLRRLAWTWHSSTPARAGRKASQDSGEAAKAPLESSAGPTGEGKQLTEPSLGTISHADPSAWNILSADLNMATDLLLTIQVSAQMPSPTTITKVATNSTPAPYNPAVTLS